MGLKRMLAKTTAETAPEAPLQKEDHANDHSAIGENEGANEPGLHTKTEATLPHGRHPPWHHPPKELPRESRPF